MFFSDVRRYGDLSLAKYSINTHGTYKEDIVIVGTNGYIVNLNATVINKKSHVIESFRREIPK